MSAPGRWSRRRRQRRHRFSGLPRLYGVSNHCRHRRPVSRCARSRSRGPGCRRGCRALPEVRGRGREVCPDGAPPARSRPVPRSSRPAGRRESTGPVLGGCGAVGGGGGTALLCSAAASGGQDPASRGADPAQPGPPERRAVHLARSRPCAPSLPGPRRRGPRPVSRPRLRRPVRGRCVTLLRSRLLPGRPRLFLPATTLRPEFVALVPSPGHPHMSRLRGPGLTRGDLGYRPRPRGRQVKTNACEGTGENGTCRFC